MAEMPDVVTLTTISTDWGNDIRDRTVQRYSSVANRTSEHGSPVEGDLSYLSDSNTVWVYDGAAWLSVYPPDPALFEVDNSTEVASYVLTGSYANAAAVTLSIPTSWGSWKCEAYATYSIIGATGSGDYNVRFSIDGTATQAQEDLSFQALGAVRSVGALGGRRTGMTTTGTRTIAFQTFGTVGTGGTLADIYLYARAVRTS